MMRKLMAKLLSKETLPVVLKRHLLDVVATAMRHSGHEAALDNLPVRPRLEIIFNASTGRWTCRRAASAKG